MARKNGNKGDMSVRAAGKKGGERVSQLVKKAKGQES